jgi:hypothetical protein
MGGSGVADHLDARTGERGERSTLNRCGGLAAVTMGELFGVELRPHNRWGGAKILRQRWQAHIQSTLSRPVLLGGAGDAVRRACRTAGASGASFRPHDAQRRPRHAPPMPEDELPTPRSTLQARYVAVLLSGRSCLRSTYADLQALIAAGHGDTVVTNSVPPFSG